MMQLSSKNADSSLCYDVIIMHQKFSKLTNLVIFRAILIITVGQAYLGMLSPLLLINVPPGRLQRTQSFRQPRSASKRSALVSNKSSLHTKWECFHFHQRKHNINYRNVKSHACPICEGVSSNLNGVACIGHKLHVTAPPQTPNMVLCYPSVNLLDDFGAELHAGRNL